MSGLCSILHLFFAAFVLQDLKSVSLTPLRVSPLMFGLHFARSIIKPSLIRCKLHSFKDLLLTLRTEEQKARKTDCRRISSARHTCGDQAHWFIRAGIFLFLQLTAWRKLCRRVNAKQISRSLSLSLVFSRGGTGDEVVVICRAQDNLASPCGAWKFAKGWVETLERKFHIKCSTKQYMLMIGASLSKRWRAGFFSWKFYEFGDNSVTLRRLQFNDFFASQSTRKN